MIIAIKKYNKKQPKKQTYKKELELLKLLLKYLLNLKQLKYQYKIDRSK